jgi:hypothetical protein
MTKREIITEFYAPTDDVLFADGFDDAIIGFNEDDWVVVYSRQKCVDILASEFSEEVGVSNPEEVAREYLEYNTFSAYVGERTPLFIDDLNWEQKL